MIPLAACTLGWLQPHLLSTPLRPPPTRHLDHEQLAQRHRLNLGKAIDTINHDHPLLFSEKPDLSIYSKSVCLAGESGTVRLNGKEAYARLYDGLRWARSSGFLGEGTQVQHRLVECNGDLRVRWAAELEIRDPFFLHHSETIHCDGISIYTLNRVGLVRKHVVSNVVLSGPKDVSQLVVQTLWLPLGVGVSEGPILAPRSERLF